MKLHDKTAVVTGAARGIGLAICRRLVREGCAVTLWDLDGTALEAARAALCAEARELFGRDGKRAPATRAPAVFAHPVDVTDKAEVHRLAALAVKEMGRVDILVNNAGVLFSGNFMDQPEEKWEKMIDVNLTSLVYAINAFLPAMLERDSGHVVNISSAAGTVGVGGLAVYAATKWAVWGLTESMRHEAKTMGKRGVKWSTVHPNYIAEGMFEGARIPGLGGLLVPVLRHHDIAAKAVVESALKRGRHSPKRPRTVKLASILRGLLPDGAFNAFARFLNIHRSMESWTGGRGGLAARPAAGHGLEKNMKIETAVPLKNPATGGIIGQVKRQGAEDLKRAVEAARKAQPAWAALSVKKRMRYIRRVRDRLAARADGVAEVISRSTGKTRVDAMSTEVLPSAMAATYYARIAPRVTRPQKLDMGNILLFNKASQVTRVPFGVVGIISPWNYPFSIPFHEVVTALLAGNAVILKVATQVQLVGEEIAALISAAGLPPGVFSLIHLPGREAGTAMLEAGVDKLFFTGSTEVGKELMAKAAQTLTPLVLELGGNDAMIVLDDADPYRAAAGAMWAGLSNAGQSCAGVERVYVHQGIYDRFRDQLVKMTAQLKVGPDLSFDVDVGSLTQADQKRKVEKLVDDAVAKGAVVACRAEARGDGDGGGLFFPVMVLENVNDGMSVMREEVFGPVLALEKVTDDAEAVKKANASKYGLTASVWSRSGRRARRVADQLEVGTVTLNDHLMAHGLAEVPWGGFKQSGFGRSHGEIGFLEMTQVRAVVRDRMHRLRRNMWWYPHGKRVYDGLRAAVTVLYGRGLFRRAGALFRVIGLYMRSFTKK